MANIIFVAICIAGEAFLFYCLFHFVREEVTTLRANKIRSALFRNKQPLAAQQSIEPVSTAIWPERGWRLQITDHSQRSSKRRVPLQAKR